MSNQLAVDLTYMLPISVDLKIYRTFIIHIILCFIDFMIHPKVSTRKCSHFFLGVGRLSWFLRRSSLRLRRGESTDKFGHNIIKLINLWREILAEKWAQGYKEEGSVSDAGKGKICKNTGRCVESRRCGHTNGNAPSIAGALITAQSVSASEAGMSQRALSH
jgi:hypothetical protein